MNALLSRLHIGPIDWLGNPDVALYTLGLLTVWQFGSSMVLFLAGIQQIPSELYEVGSIDGASKSRMFFNITLPLLTPIVWINLVMQMVNVFQDFTGAFIITGGGPLKSTYLYALKLYEEAFTSSFKPNSDIFGSTNLLPSTYVWDAYALGWKGTGQYGFQDFFINTFIMVVPTVLFSVMIAALMLPNASIMIPRYILFKELGWLDSYLPFIIPAAFATGAFFVYLMIQFIRGLPRDLDEAVTIDGCNSFTVLTRVLLPLCKPAIFSVGIFQFNFVEGISTTGLKG